MDRKTSILLGETPMARFRKTSLAPGLSPHNERPFFRPDAPKAPPALLEWIKARIQLPGYVPSMWQEEHDVAASAFLLDKSVTKLLLYVDKDLGLCLQPLYVPLKKVGT